MSLLDGVMKAMLNYVTYLDYLLIIQQLIPSLKHNYEGSREPLSSDSAENGYTAGSFWLDTENIWLCVYSEEGFAIWKIISRTIVLGESSILANAYMYMNAVVERVNLATLLANAYINASGTIVVAAVPDYITGYVFGGNIVPTTLKDVLKYDPDTWTAMTDHASYLQRNAAASYNDLAYVMAGSFHSSSTGTNFVADNDKYDPSGDSWAGMTDVPSPIRYDASAINLAAYIYLIGGTDSSTSYGISDNDEYDPSGNSWTGVTSLPAPVRQGVSLFNISDKAYATGGYWYDGFDDQVIADHDEYDQSGDSWTSKTDIPNNNIAGYSLGRYNHCGVDINSKGYVFSGVYSDEFWFLRTTIETDEYVVDTWTTKANTLTVKLYSIALNIDDKGYVISGSVTIGTNIADVDEYNTSGDSWTAMTDIPTAVYEHTGASV